MRVFGLFLGITLAIQAVALEPWKQTAKRVLMIDSYASMDLWTSDIRDGFRERLNAHNVRVNYETYELAIRFQPNLEPTRGDLAALRIKLRSTHYDLIVTSNNAATDLFLSGALELPEDTPLISSAYTGDLEKARAQKRLNATGVEVPLNLFDNLLYAIQLLPGTSQIVLVADATADGRTQGALQKRLLDSDHNVDIVLLNGSDYTTAEMFTELGKIRQDAIILFNSWGSTKDDLPEASYTALPRIREACPHNLLMGKYDCYLRLGAEAGIQPSGMDAGRVAAEMAVRIFSGERAGDLAVAPCPVKQVLDHAAIRRLHINKRAIPAETVIINTPPGILILYSNEIILGALLFVITTLFTLFMLFRRRKTMEMAQTMFAALPVRVVVVNRKMNALFVNVPDDPELAAVLAQNGPGQSPITEEQLLPCVEQAKLVFADGQSRKLEFEWKNNWRHAEFHPLPREVFQQETVMWFSSDITALHEAHTAMTQMASRFRLTLESIGDGVIATDKNGRVTLLNPVASRLTGYSLEEAEGKPLESIFNIVSYITGEKVPSPLKKALKTNATVELANHTDLIAKDGSRRHIADCASPIHDESGAIAGGVLVFRDVTEDYQKRDRMRMDNAVLGSVAEIAKITYFSCDASGAIMFQSGELPFSVDSADPTAPVAIEWGRLMAGEVKTIDTTHTTGTRGNKRFYRIRAVQAENEISHTRLFYGVIQDVTDFAQSEARANDNLNLFQGLMANMPSVIFAKDPDDDFRFLFCNKAFENLVGLPHDQIIGHTDFDVIASKESATLFRTDDAALADGGQRQDIKMRLPDPSGKSVTIRMLKGLFTQSDGSRLILGVGIDITREEEARLQLKTFLHQEQLMRACLEIVVHEKHGNVFPKLLEKIARSTGASESNIVLFDTPDGIPACLDCWPTNSGIRHTAHKIPPDFSWIVQQRNHRIVVIEDIETDPSPEALINRARFRQGGIRATVMTGLWLNETFVGSLGLCYAQPRTFSKVDRQFIQSLAHIAEMAIAAQRAREELERNEYQNRLILDNVSIPILLFDSQMKLVRVNRAARLLAGRSEAEIFAEPCNKTFCERSEIAGDCQVCLALQDGKIHASNLVIKGRDMHVIACPITVKGKIVFVLESCIDMTDFNKNQRELVRAMEAAQAAANAKTYFLATMSHELRTPLNAVIGFSEILQHQAVTADQQDEYLRAINLAGNSLLSLINDVLDLTKIESGQLEITTTRTELASLISEICAIFKLKLEERNLTLTLQGLETIPCLMLDSQRIRQILLNLIGNAIKFTHQGGITIRTGFTPDPADPQKGRLTIAVNDTGIGIAEEKQASIFEPFVQGHQIRGSRVYEGSGLGLAISGRLVRRMGGTLSLESRLGEGSTFTISLEAIQCPRDKNQSGPAAEALPQHPNRTILLVDDVPLNLKVLEAMLHRLNATTLLAASAQEALQQLEKQRVDLVLTDLWMPNINGQQLAETIRANTAWSGLPIYAVTADTEANASFDMTAFNGILSKPISMSALTDLLEKL